MADYGPHTIRVFNLEVIGFRDGSLFIPCIAFVELFFIRGLIIDEILGIDKLVIFEHINFANLKCCFDVVSLADVILAVDKGCIDIGA